MRNKYSYLTLFICIVGVVLIMVNCRSKTNFYQKEFDRCLDSSLYYSKKSQAYSQRFDSTGSSNFWYNWQISSNYIDSMHKYLNLIKNNQ